MKNWFKYISMVAVALIGFNSTANGKVLFFDTWHQVFELKSVGYVFESSVIMESPFELYFLKEEGDFDEKYIEDHMAALWNDSTWLINSKYLKNNFSGDGGMMRGFVPLYFNERVAYAVYMPFEDSYYDLEFYYIDFQNSKVKKVCRKYLLDLLTDYPDLKMRYEGMKCNKKHQIIEEYFLEYIERASVDLMRPCIVDLIN